MRARFDSCRIVEPAERAWGMTSERCGTFAALHARNVRHSSGVQGSVATVFVRFQGAILLTALTAIAGGVLEKSILDHRRALGRQHYQIEALRERVARARLNTERLSAMTTLSRPLQDGRLEAAPVSPGEGFPHEPPLLHWRVDPEGR